MSDKTDHKQLWRRQRGDNIREHNMYEMKLMDISNFLKGKLSEEDAKEFDKIMNPQNYKKEVKEAAKAVVAQEVK